MPFVLTRWYNMFEHAQKRPDPTRSDLSEGSVMLRRKTRQHKNMCLTRRLSSHLTTAQQNQRHVTLFLSGLR